MSVHINKLQQGKTESQIQFKEDSMDEIVIVTNKLVHSKDKTEKPYYKEIKLITQDKNNFQIIDGKVSDYYYGTLAGALTKLYMLLNSVSFSELKTLEVYSYILSFDNIKPYMVNKNIDTEEILNIIKQIKDNK